MTLHASRRVGGKRALAATSLELLALLALFSGCNGIVGGNPLVEKTGAGAATASGAAPGSGAGPATGAGGAAAQPPGQVADACAAGGVQPGSSPLRRITRFEYNNTMNDLLGDTTQPAKDLPSEEIGNGFSNDADSQSVSSLLAAQYSTVAQGIAARATATPDALSKILPCSKGVTASGEEACARTFIQTFGARAYRRALLDAEVDPLLTLEKQGRENTSFAAGIATVIEVMLQAPDFLYKVEWGTPDAAKPNLRRPSGDEMATRLSYLFWGAPPDDALRAAAQAGELVTADGVLKQATRLLDNDRSKATVAFFFDNLLPINALTDLTRDATLFPTFTPSVGALMHQETQTFLAHEIFDNNGSWSSVLTAPYTYVNETLAKFYGIAGVQGNTFQKVNTDPTQRIGVLLQGGVMAGSVTTDKSNPVLRGSFVLNKLLCQTIHPPTDPAILAQVRVPDDTTGATARDRFSKHSSNPICHSCHALMDPIGFSLENFDPVGQYRTQENSATIDASGSVPGTEGTINGPVELVQKLASDEAVDTCFATHWLNFAYGRTLGQSDACVQQTVNAAFKKSGYNVKQLLLELTQTDAFLYLPASQ